MSGACLGDALTALVDGELDHVARERALGHLAGCADCRAEVDAHRRLKARLAGLDADPVPPSALTSRLLALAVPGVDLRSHSAPSRSGLVRPVPVGPPLRSDRVGPSGRRPAGARRHRRQATGVLVAVGLGAALALGGPGGSGSSTPLDPGADVFVVDHVSTTGRLPLREPAARVASLPSR